MTRGEHARYHNSIDMSDRKCTQCGSDKNEDARKIQA